MRFIDTNVIVRHLANDLPREAEACRRLFRRLESHAEEAVTNELVIAETAHVLTSRVTYNLSHEAAASALRTIVQSPGLRLPRKNRVLRALDLLGAHQFLDFVDAMILVQLEEGVADEILSYDRDFDKIQAAVRVEP